MADSSFPGFHVTVDISDPCSGEEAGACLWKTTFHCNGKNNENKLPEPEMKTVKEENGTEFEIFEGMHGIWNHFPHVQIVVC